MMKSFFMLWSLLGPSPSAALPWQDGAERGHHQVPVVSTSSGNIHGKVDHALPNVRQYLGVPFAAPPVGNLRWAAPQPLNQPKADIQATHLAPSCMQYLTDLGDSLYVRDVLQFNIQGLNRTGTVSEDCLLLNVWTPSNATAGAALPVFVFLPGGGFTTGGADVPYQIPTQWVNRSPDHLVVTINYRLNIFGFPNAAGLTQQNLGLLDQRAAVEWVQHNIAAFGGDPERIVLWGQSAGAISVDYYNYAYHSDPIVKGLIMDSGTAFTAIASNKTTHASFTLVADNVGCSGLDNDPVQQLACMRGVDAYKIENFIARYTENGTSPSLSFSPYEDDVVVFSNYTERALAGLQSKIPAIIGTNAQEGAAFAPYSPSGPNKTLALELKLADFFCPATETVRLRQLSNDSALTSFRYLYFGNWTNVSPRPWMGAYHSAEQPMIFGTHPNFRGPSTPAEYATSEAFQDAYVAFASNPSSGLVAQDWVPYTALGSEQVRGFAKYGVPVQDVSIASREVLCDGAVPKPPF